MLRAIGNQTATTKYQDSCTANYVRGSEQPIYVPNVWGNPYTETSNVQQSKEIEWTQFNGLLEIEKVDSDNTNEKLKDVEFQITGPNGYNETRKTDSNGKIRIENITPGTYTIKETSIPQHGYKATVSVNETIKNGQLLISTIKNEKQTGNLIIKKSNKDTGKVMEDIGFKIMSVDGDLNGNHKNEYIKLPGIEDENRRVWGYCRIGDPKELEYTTDINEATEFITAIDNEQKKPEDDIGYTGIFNLILGRYRVIENSIGRANDSTDKYSNPYFGYFDIDPNYTTMVPFDVASGNDTGTEENNNQAIIEVRRQESNYTNGANKESKEHSTGLHVKNRQKYVDLSGFVWDDTPSDEGKETKGNGIYRENSEDSNDRLLRNVTVNLKENDTVLRTMDTVVGQAELKEGESTYKFTRVEIDKLKQYHIEFIYNGMAYEGVELKGLTQWNTSKAAEGSARQTFNNKFKVITNNKANGDEGDIPLKYDGIIDHRSDLNYEITDSSKAYGYDGARLPINYVADKYTINATTLNAYNGGCLDKVKSPDTIRKEWTTELQHINLGVNKREQPDISVKKDIKNVKILVNGKGQIYEYDKRFSHMDESAGDGYDYGVKFGNKYAKMKYTRPIYKADVTFTSNDKNRELQVYLTYAIGIKNNSSNLSAQINEIVDFYDKRYAENSYGAEIKVGAGLTDDATITDEITFKDLGNNHDKDKSKYNEIIINTSELGRIEKQSFKTLYVQFKLSRELVYEILGEEGITQEPLDNVTEITSYSIFGTKGEVYAGIDQNSNPGNAKPGERDTYEADTDAAPSLRLEYNVERVVTGNVFEDLPKEDLLNNGIREGNGQFDAGEPGIPKVKVELLRKEAREDGTYGDWTVKTEYTTTTDANGSYTIKDFAAGDYVIRYTWGGKEHIVDVEKKYTAQNYKVTIYNDDAHEGDRWYESLTPRYSDAKDTYDDTDKNRMISGSIEDTRESIDNLNEIKHDTQPDTNKVMVSETKEMSIDIEYNPTEVYDPGAIVKPSEGQTEGQEDTYGLNRQHEMKNLDFGIIERPRQSYKLIKKINHVKLTLANGQTLIDADIDENYNVIPKETSSLTSFGPTSVGAPGYANGNIKIEMDNEILHGSTLQVTYGLSVQNTSEVDYANKLFYTYGTTKKETDEPGIHQNPVTITIKQITDYLDKEWAVNENEETFSRYNWEKKTLDQIKGDVAEKVYNGGETKIKERILLQTDYLGNRAIARNETTEQVRLVATKVLTTINDSDVELDNEAEITRITKTGGGLLTTNDPNDPTKKKTITITPGNYVPGTGYKIETEPEDDMAQTVTVTPNTGENMNLTLPILIGIAALAILGTGIILIKKTVWGSQDKF